MLRPLRTHILFWQIRYRREPPRKGKPAATPNPATRIAPARIGSLPRGSPVGNGSLFTALRYGGSRNRQRGLKRPTANLRRSLSSRSDERLPEVQPGCHMVLAGNPGGSRGVRIVGKAVPSWATGGSPPARKDRVAARKHRRTSRRWHLDRAVSTPHQLDAALGGSLTSPVNAARPKPGYARARVLPRTKGREGILDPLRLWRPAAHTFLPHLPFPSDGHTP